MPIPIPDIFQLRGHNVTSYLLSHRVLFYTLTSTVAVSATIASALQDHSNFYSVAVYLSKSGRSVLVRFSDVCCAYCIPLTFYQVLVNFALLIALACARLVQQIFFGDLRPLEVEVR
jgi:E3 ubiquitin-protein ligase synoviolin